MLSTVLYFAQCVAEISLLGSVEAASVAIIIYYLFAKTRAPAIIANLFPNLNLNYRSSLEKFNNISGDLLLNLSTTNANDKDETKPNESLKHDLGTENMLRVTPHAGRKPFKGYFDWGVYFPYFAQALRSKKFNYAQVSDRVFENVLYKQAIKKAAEQIMREEKSAGNGFNHVLHRSISERENNLMDDTAVYQRIFKSQQKRGYNIIMDMRSTLNNVLLSLTSWLLYKLLPSFLSGVVTNTKQIKMLKTISEQNPETPLIFIPLHRSHIDYLMVSFILTNNDIRSPLVAAGNNLQIPIFGSLLRGLGAFFIKRKIDPVEGKKDVLYRAALQLYIQQALKDGHNIEFFIEGGRTRTGKPCMPKGGILSVIVNAFMDGSIPDALLVPVSLNYERLVEGNFVREQKGEKKMPESFLKAMSGIYKALKSNYGLMCIDFNEPYSLRELVNTYSKMVRDDAGAKLYKSSIRTLQHNQSTSSLFGTDVVCEDQRNLIDSISRQVVYDCGTATTVMSTNALAFLLLNRYRKGADENEIVAGMEALRKTLRGRKGLGFSGKSAHIIKYACDLLGQELVERTTNAQGNTIIRPVPKIESFIELCYYSNVLAPHFALKSILLITFHKMLPQKMKSDVQEPVGVPRSKLINLALDNCEIFKHEFILHKPTQHLEQLLEREIDDLLFTDLVRSSEDNGNYEAQQISRKIANYIDDISDDMYDTDNTHKSVIFFVADTIKEQRYLCEVLAPFSTAYYAVAKHLQILHKCAMLETEFIKSVISHLTSEVESGTCLYAESISTDSVRNCLKLLEKWSVIEVCSQKGMRVIALGTQYEATKDLLKPVVQRIANIVPNYENGYY